MKYLVVYFTFCLMFFCFSVQLFGSDHYNEVFNSSGELRPKYKKFAQHLNPSQALIKQLMFDHPLGDNIKIFPIPYVLDQEVYDQTIKRGIRQRALALARCFEDLILGEMRIVKSGILSLRLVERIFKEEGWSFAYLKKLWAGKNFSDIQFPYGADLFFDGKWKVFEDNIGPIGGFADLFTVQQAFKKIIEEETGKNVCVMDGCAFKSAVLLFLKVHNITPNKKNVIALLSTHKPKYWRFAAEDRAYLDLESEREKARLKELNIEVLSADEDLSFDDKVDKSQVEAVVNLHSPKDKKSYQELMVDLFKKKGVQLFLPPGIDVMSHKAFMPYVEKMIEFYLQEDPILEGQESHVLEEVAIPDDYKNWVLKKADSARGEDVHIFSRMTEEERDELIEDINVLHSGEEMSGDAPSIYMLQRHASPSVIPWGRFQYMIDLRPMAYFSGVVGTAFVSSVPWSRVTNVYGLGLNNVSQGAYEGVVLLHKECEEKL